MAEIDTGNGSPGATATLTDRRRRGRVDYQNPHLIALLRQPGEDVQPAEPIVQATTQPAVAEVSPDTLAPARGVFLGILLGACLWVVGALAMWLYF